MGVERRLPLFGGLLLIMIGGVLLINQFIPEWNIEFSWPWIIIVVGVGLLMLGMLTGAPAMAIPACIVGGIGGILLYQDVSGNWASWAYLWTLIPGFAGVGTILTGLLRGDLRGSLREGTQSILFSAVAFVIFAGLFGALGDLGAYWPVALIAVGVLSLISALLPKRTRPESGEE